MTRSAMVACLLLSSCSRSTGPTPSADAAASTPAVAAASSAPPAPAGPTAWSGTYEAKPGTLFVPDGGEWSGVKFRGDDASAGLGEGTLTVRIDSATGRVEGTTDGPLGQLAIAGLLRDGVFSASLTPADPNRGFSGAAMGKREGNAIAGSIHLSNSIGATIREASFSLKTK